MRAEGRPRDRAGALSRGRGGSRRHRPRAGGDGEHARHAGDPRRGAAASSAGDNKYTSGHVLVVGGSPGMTGAAALVCPRRPSGRRGLRHHLRAGGVHPRDRGARRRGGEAPAAGGPSQAAASALGGRPILEAAERARRVAIGPGLGRSEGTASFVRILLERLPVHRRPRCRRALGARPVRAEGRDRDDSARGRARAAARHRARRDRRAPARIGAPRRVAFRPVVLLKGADTLVAAPREGVLVAASYGTTGPRHRRNGRRARRVVGAFLAKGMEPKLAAAASGRSRTASPPELVERAARALVAGTCCRSFSARSTARAPSSTRSPASTRAAAGPAAVPARRGPGECLGPGGHAVPPRHHDLQLAALDRLDDLLGDQLRRRDEPVQAALEARALREPGRLDEPRVHGVHRDAASRKLDRDRARDASWACLEAE